MDALTRIRAKINAFPGYTSEEDIRRSDQLIRAYVGEQLSEMQARLGDASSDDALSSLLMRTSFANQRELRPLEEPKEVHREVEALFDADAALIDLADRASSVAGPDLAAYVASVGHAFDARDAALASLVPPP